MSLAAAMLMLGITGGQAQPSPKDLSCDGSTEREINACLHAQAQSWDKYLNQEYRAALNRFTADQKPIVVKAQRLWVQYRDANCAVGFAHGGTVAVYLGTKCILNMTRDRAKELHGLHDEDDD